jgi:serine protease Do
MNSLARCVLLLASVLLSAVPVSAQPPISPDHQRSSPKMLQAFREVVAKPSQATVRVLCDGKDIALGTIVEADGWIVTKASELQGKVTCRLKDGRTLTAQIVGVQEPYDLALLKVDAKGLPPVSWRASKDAHVGQWVASPGPTEEPVAIGVVSVATRKYKVGDQPTKNLGAKSGWLGVGLDESEGGAHIGFVVPDSPAQRAGLRTGDLILEVAGKKILDNESLINTVQRHHPGEEIKIKIRRGSEEQELTATLGQLPPQMRGNPQERMGSQLSNRRGGFPTILQHDTVLKPVDCGGPLVDLDGRTIGINIARAGRTESYAVPSEDVLFWLPDLKSGKLAPTVEVTGPTSPRERKTDANLLRHDVNRLTRLVPAPKGRPGCHSRAYSLELAAGEQVTIDLESLEFDAFLRVEDADGKKLAEDDDSGGELNARIVFRAPRGGTYHVIVTSYTPGETGNYELTIRRTGAAPPAKK